MPRKPVSANFKIVLVFLAILIVVAVLLYTQTIVRKLQEREFENASFYTEAIEYIVNDESPNGDYTFPMKIVNNIDFPILMTDSNHVPQSGKNLPVDSTLSPDALMAAHLSIRDRMREVNPPIVVTYQDSVVLNFVYYDESDLVKDLRRLPYIEILLAGMFILVGYIGFSYIKRSEQANIWVGLSKETAHQLGTPLMSLMGWLELLRAQKDDPEGIIHTLDDMENDVNRLSRIALRFSKIGSRPELVDQDLMVTLRKAAEYLRKRSPQLGRKVDIIVPAHGELRVRYNAELLEWVFENLMKNALDAIEEADGRIEFIVEEHGRYAVIDVRDNGKGIDTRRKKDIFRPGYSTKKRGWGLGLSLSKRIVEDYHKGKLFVHDSSPGRGTTFRIKLPK